MKKLFLFLTLLISGIGMTWADTTLTTAQNNEGNGYYGFTAKLSDTFYTATGDDMNDEVYLKTLDIYGRQSSGSGSEFKVAIYKYSADGTTGDFVAISDNSNTYANCGSDFSVSMTFNFTGVKLTKTQQYQFLFVNKDATATSVTTFDTYKAAAVGESLRMFSNSSIPGGDGTYNCNTLNGWAGSYMPAVKFVVSNNDPSVKTYLYKLKHNKSGLYLSLNETDGYDGSDNSKNAATFAATGTEFFMTASGDNYIFTTTTGKTLAGAKSGKEWNFSNTTENSTNTTWKVTTVDGGVTIQPVAGLYANKYVGNVNTTINAGDYVYTNQDDATQIWTIEQGSEAPEQVTITFNYKYNGATVKSVSKNYNVGFSYTSPDLRGYSITAVSGTASETASVDVECTPYVPYQYVYIANDNDTKLQSSDESGTLTFAATDNRIAEKYIWKVTITSDGYYNFQNLSTGKYMKHKGIQDAAYNFELRTGLASGNYAIFSVADDRYLVIKYDGTLDQATGTYSKSSTDYSTDYIFEKAVINTLTINTIPAVTGVFTWNGTTKTGSTVTFSKIAGQTVTDKSVTASDNGYTASLSASEWDGESDLTITATMTESFYSTNYGDKWVRISSAINSNYVMSAGAETTNMATANVDVTAGSQLFCFVGNATDGFKIYSKAKGSSVALYTADTNSGTAPSWKEAASASTWFLDSKYLSASSQPGYGLTTQDVTTSSDRQSLNLWGGGIGEAKFYGNGSGNGGSRWAINNVEPFTLTVNCEGTKSEMNQMVGSFSYSADGVTTSTNVTYATLDKSSTMYLPKAKSITVDESSFVTYPGYEFVSQTYDDNTLTVNYKATDARWLFQTYGHGRPYRIPAIAKAKNNDLIAISDDRYCGNDIGYGQVNLVYKVSHDSGATWGAETMLAEGDGESSSNTCGFGDAAIVADRTSDKVMVMCVSAPNGGTCWTAKQRSSIIWGTPNEDGTWTFTKPVDIKDKIMALLPTDRINYFVGSGKLHQSRYVKVGDYYRVYVPLWTTAGSDINNYVVYTDDFGQTFKLLGTTSVCPGPNGNEPKCEELPDGSVLLSSRQPYHRLLNIYTYTDAATGAGSWGTSATGINNNDGSGTDGEILVVNALRKSDNTIVPIALQSSPNNGRAKVSIWYKVLADNSAYSSPSVLGSNWTLGKQITSYSSAYSTMIMQADGRLGFYYEDGQSGAGYDMIYVPLTLEELTNSQYSFNTTVKKAEGSSEAAPVLEGTVSTPESVAELVDETATSVDMTNTSLNGTTIEEVKASIVEKTGNENTIVFAPATTTVEATTTNVVVDGTCQSLVVTDGNTFSTPKEFTAVEADYDREMTSQWGTLCLPYEIKADHANALYDLYTVNSMSEGVLEISRVQDGKVPAGTPLIVYRNASEAGIDMNNSNVKVVISEVAGENKLVGCLKPTLITEGFYIASDAFWNAANVSGGVTVPAFRAYINNTSNARSLTIRVTDGSATGVTMIRSNDDFVKDGKFVRNGNIVILRNGKTYNAAGQQIK